MAEALLRRPGWRSPKLLDAAVVGGLLATDVVGQAVVSAGGRAESAPLGPLALLLAAISAAVLWWRRTHPLAALLGVLLVALVAGGAAPPGLLTQNTALGIVVATFAVASWSQHRRWALALPTVLIVLLVLGALGDGAGLVQAGAIGLAVVALPWAAGQAARTRRRYLDEVERRLEEAERDREERARRAVLDERTHIARELHDVVAHHVSLIGVQAGAARTALDAEPETTRQALVAIEESSRRAVGEMRHLLGALRQEEPGPGDLDPQPGLPDLADLIEGFAAAGVHAALVVDGDPVGVAPVVGLCCYRIVEEALTNVARHSSAGRATVEVRVTGSAVHLEVDDVGPARAGGGGTGRGLVGMAERVALFGDVLQVGPTPGGGFAVSATIPREVS